MLTSSTVVNGARLSNALVPRTALISVKSATFAMPIEAKVLPILSFGKDPEDIQADRARRCWRSNDRGREDRAKSDYKGEYACA
jgi:hypothetical protein